MCSTYTKDDSKCEKDSRGNEFKKGEWNPYCALNLGCCELGCLQPPIACMCYTTPSEGQGTWLWGSIGMGGGGALLSCCLMAPTAVRPRAPMAGPCLRMCRIATDIPILHCSRRRAPPG